jgi:OmpA family protein
MKISPELRFPVGLSFGLSLFLVFCAQIASAQTDMFIYPGKGQDQAQQDKDRYECHSWAVQQTGFDPTRPQSANAQPASQSRSSSPPPVLQGAARGAALGAVGGAITGNAGKGAAAGAAMGGMVGGFRRRDEKIREADRRADAAAKSSPGRDAYMRAMSACLQGRGYTVN